jgi:TnpA family transposase
LIAQQYDELVKYAASLQTGTAEAEAMLALHLLQVSLVYVNTLMIQEVLAEPA